MTYSDLASESSADGSTAFLSSSRTQGLFLSPGKSLALSLRARILLCPRLVRLDRRRPNPHRRKNALGRARSIKGSANAAPMQADSLGGTSGGSDLENFCRVDRRGGASWVASMLFVLSLLVLIIYVDLQTIF
jgi:hypothetical protein